ncbi:MAG: hypothetical protein JXA89_07555 [Anaerolineae bacterium]|nr:hypothetical protein [Anaerolineae bacterium]
MSEARLRAIDPRVNAFETAVLAGLGDGAYRAGSSLGSRWGCRWRPGARC